VVRPLTLDAREVRAVLAGTMTEVRRPILPPRAGSRGPWRPSGPVVVTAHDLTDPWFEWRAGWPGSAGGEAFDRRRCAIGSPDRLWVRETWKVGSWTQDRRFAIDYAAGPVGKTPWCRPPSDVAAKLAAQSLEDCERYVARARDGDERVSDEGSRYTWEVGNSPCRWRPSTQMPRWASRLTLEVTGVRVERVQDLTEEGARASGFERVCVPNAWGGSDELTALGSFARAWDARAKPGLTWAANPWVWVVTFNKVEVQGG
jgi:hypothetical protein